MSQVCGTQRCRSPGQCMQPDTGTFCAAVRVGRGFAVCVCAYEARLSCINASLPAELLGHEGEGSVLHLLKQRGWGLALESGDTNSGFGRSTAGYLFQVRPGPAQPSPRGLHIVLPSENALCGSCIASTCVQVIVVLTEEGMDHYLDVVGVIFQYLRLLKSCGPQRCAPRAPQPPPQKKTPQVAAP
jgi:hypothetical protein